MDFEIEKERLIEEKKKVGSDQRALAECCNALAKFYYKHKCYNEAMQEYENEARICDKLKLRSKWGICTRMIGRIYTLMTKLDKAALYVQHSLNISREQNNEVENQKALSNFGIIQLLKAQKIKNFVEVERTLSYAEKAFRDSLVLCEKFLYERKNVRNLTVKQAWLYLNIGLVLQNLDNLDGALEYINKANKICSEEKLCDVLHSCYLIEASLHSNKRKDYDTALSCLNKALDVVATLKDKEVKKCKTLISLAALLCKMSDYHKAKMVFLEAWKLNALGEEVNAAILSTIDDAIMIGNIEKELASTDPSDHTSRKNYYKKLGDCTAQLQNYTDAVKYYHSMLIQAQLAGDSSKTLAPIYFSLYQCYKNMGSYNEAITYCEKQYELIKDLPKEAFNTMYHMADTLHWAKKPYEQIEKACLNARRAGQEMNEKEYEIKALKRLLMYQKLYSETEKMVQTKDDLKALGYDDFSDLEDPDDEQNSVKNSFPTANIIRDILLESLAEVSDSEEEEKGEKATSKPRRPSKGYSMKTNRLGETQLHRACIKGNKSHVEDLIAKSHPVNVRDRAGWTPLHEACIHGYKDIAAILIDNGADINDADNCDRLTPLQDAARNGYLEVMELLLEKGANPSQKTPSGESALDFLKEWRNEVDLTEDRELLYKKIYDTLKCQMNQSHEIPKTSGDSSSTRYEKSDTNILASVKENLYGVKSLTNKPVGKNGNKSPYKRLLEDSGEVNDTGTQDSSEINKNRKRNLSGNEKPTNDSQIKNTIENNNKSSDSEIENNNVRKSTRLNSKDRTPVKASPRKVSEKNNSGNARNEIQKQSAFTTVKVQVEDKLLLVPIKMDTINALTISWLISEVKSRLTGDRPVFSLMTSDGAILSEDDPLSVVLPSPELKTYNTNNNLSVDEMMVENSDVAGKDSANVAEPEENYSKSKIIELFRELIDTVPEENLNSFWSQTEFLATLYSNE